MEVHILSKRIVKPEIPTPTHLKTCELSFFDQLAPSDHVPIIYFYPKNGEHDEKLRENLVKSLSKTLTQFYPLAGRFVKDGFYVDCNDEGVLYIESEVNLELDEFLNLAPKSFHLVDDLVPRNFFGKSHLVTTPIMGLQVSFFRCGGVAICMFLSHIVADGFTAAAFIQGWANTTSALLNDEAISLPNFSFGVASFFPARDLSAAIKPPKKSLSKQNDAKIVTKRFVFDEKSISTLKFNASKSENLKRPTRVEVVTSTIWKTLVKIAAANDESKRAVSTLYLHLNLRGRTGIVTPRLPPDNASMCGNFYMQVPTKFKANDEKMEGLELEKLCGLLRTSLHDSLVNCSKITSPNDLFMGVTKNVNEIVEDMGNDEVNVRLLTTLCRLPLYETDFGWGKPEWVTIPSMPLEIVFLLDTKCGNGIEAMVSLNELEMVQFEIDPTITAFTS